MSCHINHKRLTHPTPVPINHKRLSYLPSIPFNMLLLPLPPAFNLVKPFLYSLHFVNPAHDLLFIHVVKMLTSFSSTYRGRCTQFCFGLKLSSESLRILVRTKTGCNLVGEFIGLWFGLVQIGRLANGLDPNFLLLRSKSGVLVYYHIDIFLSIISM